VEREVRELRARFAQRRLVVFSRTLVGAKFLGVAREVTQCVAPLGATGFLIRQKFCQTDTAMPVRGLIRNPALLKQFHQLGRLTPRRSAACCVVGRNAWGATVIACRAVGHRMRVVT
jgi:hypothetical protein